VDGVAPELIFPITATSSSQYQADRRLAAHAVDGSGLVGNAHGTTSAGTMWLNNGTLVVPNDLNPFIVFDLGSVQPIRRMKLWNYNEAGAAQLQSRGVSRADVLVSETNGGFTMLLAGQAFAKAPGTQTDFSENFDLGGIRARFVRIEKMTNFPGGDNNFVGLSEVQFFRDVDLRGTEAPLGAKTYYFRKSFNFGGDPARAELLLSAVADDGAVFYLNGTEIYRFNVPAGPLTHSTLAQSSIAHATFSGPISVSAANLVRGANVLAVEVHQAASSGDPDMIFGADLTARVSPPPPQAFSPGGLVFNEISAASTTDFRIELVNNSGQSLNVGGYAIRRSGPSPDAQYTLAAQTVGAGQFLVLDQATTGLGTVPGDKLFLMLPGGRGVADALEVHERPRARSPDGTGEWLTPNAVSLGTSNTFTLHNEVVINEIMYHAPPTLETPPIIATNLLITLKNLLRY